MDKLIFTSAMAAIYFSIFPAAHAQSCADVVNQARLALPASFAKPPAALWNLSWLQGRLGQADTSSVVETYYKWEKGDLLVRDNVVVKANLPSEAAAINAVNDILYKMGPPVKVESTILVQYRWICLNNPSYLEILMDKNKLVYAAGQTCTNSNNCASFSGAIMPSQFEGQMDTVSRDMTLPAEQLKAYNDYFKTTITNDQDLSADMIARAKAYLSDLRECRPGTYYYAAPDEEGLTLVSSTIKGLQDNFCIVETKQQANTGDNAALPVAKCQYQQQNLAIFMDVEAENLIKGIDNPQIEKIQETQCRVFLGDKEIPAGTSQN